MRQPRPTPEMQRCLIHMRQHGGELQRWPGGFWTRMGWDPKARHDLAEMFGDGTVQGLVSRELATYTQYRTNTHSRQRYPVRVRLADRPPQSDLDLPEVARVDTVGTSRLESPHAVG